MIKHDTKYDSKKSTQLVSGSSANFTENTFYRRTPSESKVNPELLQQALLPPSPLFHASSHSRSYYSSPSPKNRYANVNGASIINGSNDGLPGRPRRRNTLKSFQFFSSTKGMMLTRRGNGGEGNNNSKWTWRKIPSIGRLLSSSSTVTRAVRNSIAKNSSNLDFFSGDTKVSSSNNSVITTFQLPVAVVSWYVLGILSISTTKILLRDWEIYGVSPLILTVQQFCIGISFLRAWIQLQSFAPPRNIDFGKVFTCFLSTKNKFNTDTQVYVSPTSELYLLLSATFYTLGFLITNQSFFNSDASFVETIKASEPLTSASLAVLWGLERLSLKEVGSLISICVGLALATLGNAYTLRPELSSDASAVSGGTTFVESMILSGTILLANICFSFRGLYQKLFRASPTGSVTIVDDLNLQFRMHQVGILILLIPLVGLELPRVAGILVTNEAKTYLLSWKFIKYAGLAIVNGFAFTHYNLASAYVLTRLSVVNHAALNCVRRLFAIVVTAFLFSVQLTIISGLGIVISIAGFLTFSFYKMYRIKETRPLSSLLPLPR